MHLLLIDDHPLFGLGFVQALTHARAHVDVRSVLTLDQGLEVASRWATLDAVLIDYRLGGDDGIEGLRRFGMRHPLVARVLISGDEDAMLVTRARAAGASAFLGKSMGLDELFAALDVVCEGGEFFAPRAPREASAPGGSPTARQLEVLALIGSGRQNKQIAFELGIAERTVKLHVTALLNVAGARNRTHLLVRARELGWL